MHDAGAQWLDFALQTEQDARVAQAFGLSYPFDEDAPDIAKWLALFDLGVTSGFIAREPHFRRAPKLAARDADLDRPTLHQSPLWRHPITGEETGEPALIVPVSAAHDLSAHTMQRSASNDDDFVAAIDDLLAIPFAGARTLSLTGHSVAINAFAAVGGRLTVFAGGKAWLDAHLAHVARLCGDTLPHLVEQVHFTLPDERSVGELEPVGAPRGTLVIEPRALEWRVALFDCVIPPDAREVVCPDSRKLAELIDATMRKRPKQRALPVVRGPSAPRGAQRALEEGAPA